MIFFYQIILQIIRFLKPLHCFLPHKKVRYFLKNQGKIYSTQNFSDRPLWIHASSGEIEYAKSLIREIKTQYPQVPLLVTHTSLSSENVVSKLGAAAWGLAPLDTPQDVAIFLQKWRPLACLIARTDIWPQTVKELDRLKIPTYLFSATFAEGSKKISFFSRLILKNALPLIKKIYFVSSADEMICKSFFPNIKGEITGDTRYDQVFFRLQEKQKKSLPSFEKILIAGSTWAEDEKVLIPAFEQLKKNNWKFILVPHEVEKSHLTNIQQQMEKASLKYCLYSQDLSFFSWENFDVLLIDQVGQLATLYSNARIAFIGGSFRKQVHSVMEALATNTPVVVGPYYQNNREALEFKEKGFVQTVQNSSELIDAILKFDSQYLNLNSKLKIEIKKHLGATEKVMQDLKAQGIFQIM